MRIVFEPMAICSLLHVSIIIAVLVAITSARWVGEISADPLFRTYLKFLFKMLIYFYYVRAEALLHSVDIKRTLTSCGSLQSRSCSWQSSPTVSVCLRYSKTCRYLGTVLKSPISENVYIWPITWKIKWTYLQITGALWDVLSTYTFTRCPPSPLPQSHSTGFWGWEESSTEEQELRNSLSPQGRSKMKSIVAVTGADNAKCLGSEFRYVRQPQLRTQHICEQ